MAAFDDAIRVLEGRDRPLREWEANLPCNGGYQARRNSIVDARKIVAAHFCNSMLANQHITRLITRPDSFWLVADGMVLARYPLSEFEIEPESEASDADGG
jgi:hypothetical protein